MHTSKLHWTRTSKSKSPRPQQTIFGICHNGPRHHRAERGTLHFSVSLVYRFLVHSSMLPQKIWLPENVSGAFWQQFLGWFSSNFYSCILSQRPPPNLSTSLKLVAIFTSSNFTATLANFGLYLWSPTNNLYLYSLTEDDKEERAEDEGASWRRGSWRRETWRRGSWQLSRRFTWCSCDTMNYIIKRWIWTTYVRTQRERTRVNADCTDNVTYHKRQYF